MTRQTWEGFRKEKAWVLQVKKGSSRMMRRTHSVWGAEQKQRGEDMESAACPDPVGTGVRGAGHAAGRLSQGPRTVGSLEYRGTFIQWVTRNG